MRAFISYASEQRDLAQRLSLGLRNEGNSAFFDRDALPAGGSFDDRIRRAVQRSHLFVFLISKDSLCKGAYTLTELSLAQKRWPHPAGKVLPVLVDDTPIDALPPYLRSVSVLDPKGDLVADVLAAVGRLSKEHRAAVGIRLILAGIALLLVFGIWSWLFLLKRQPFIENVRITSVQEASKGVSDEFRFDITLKNPGPEAITMVGIAPYAESGGVSFSGAATEYLNLNRDETKSVSFVTALRKDPGVTSFRWRMCWGYVKTEDLFRELYPQNTNVEIFMTRYRQEVCSSWRAWPKDQ